jgi:hypothetical protein
MSQRMSGGVGGALSDGCPYPYRYLTIYSDVRRITTHKYGKNRHNPVSEGLP